ncbi:hypothetical protein [Gemmatimonas aurantiaca]|uniref:hypothetical protein n=1 Tax=Gemmatimonas aurantiaca TaxID=173480 RepID=UPI00301E022F
MSHHFRRRALPLFSAPPVSASQESPGSTPDVPDGAGTSVRIVRTGTWRRADGAPRAEQPEARPDEPSDGQSVDIVALDYDWWYAMAEADGQLAPGEVPARPDAEGWLYYVRFTDAANTHGVVSVDSMGYATISAAMRYAASKVRDAIRWR